MTSQQSLNLLTTDKIFLQLAISLATVIIKLIKMTKILHNELQSSKSQYKLLDEESLNKMALITNRSSVSIQAASKYKCSTIIVLSIVGLLCFSFLSASFHPVPKAVNVVFIETDKPPVHITNSRFLSIGLDSSIIAEGFRKFDMGSEKLKKMMQHLSPGYIRIGGTLADRLLFIPNDTLTLKTNYLATQDGDVCAYENVTCNVQLRPNFTISGTEWLQLNELAAETGFVILFDLNSLLRYKNGSWNSTNAKELINFSDLHNLTLAWELGNEPNAFRHVFNYSVNATQMSKDFVVLRNALNKYPRYRDSLLVGPDVTRPRPENKQSTRYLKEFLGDAGTVVDAITWHQDSLLVGPDVTRPRPENKQSTRYLEEFLGDAGTVVDAITWHQYYLNGRTATAEDFVDPEIFDLLASQADAVKDIANSHGLQSKPIWLGETAAAYGGGAPGFNNRYIGTFIWLDKLGLAAKKGLDVVVRQSIFKGFYALLDNNYDPTPDYWISVLFKAFVGPEVVSCHSASSPKVRLYCQCTNKEFMKSSVTVYGMNMKDSDAVIRLQGGTSTGMGKIYVYILTPHVSLFSKNIYLNKEMLVMDADGNLPPFKPYVLQDDARVVLPPFSTAFIVIPSEVLACNED